MKDAGHRTCPRTQLTLLHTALTPNYVLKDLIALWCESNGVELPKKQGNCRTTKSGSSLSDCDRTGIGDLLDKLTSTDIEQQRAAAGELRLLAKRNADDSVYAEEHAVTALLNLLINENNKGTIVNAGAIPDVVDVLKNVSMEARENAAATYFSLSVLDENKVAIGTAGAMPALIKLLFKGTPRVSGYLKFKVLVGCCRS
ncbi:unnamed protein product [Trifolium pratense]|uniref:Uncharacterized protein n=1 Tax=Trifolium pratense TaxID=57577 RepID=A0ACB0J014_TRIPR|nr:unnamed protein product [Trifolium pratense]